MLSTGWLGFSTRSCIACGLLFQSYGTPVGTIEDRVCPDCAVLADLARMERFRAEQDKEREARERAN